MALLGRTRVAGDSYENNFVFRLFSQDEVCTFSLLKNNHLYVLGCWAVVPVFLDINLLKVPSEKD